MGKFIEKYGREKLVNRLLPDGFSRRLEDGFVPYADPWPVLKEYLINGFAGLANMPDEQLEELCVTWLRDQEFYDDQAKRFGYEL